MYTARARRLRKKALKEHSRATTEADYRLAVALRECQAMELFAGKHRRVASCKFLAGGGTSSPVIYRKQQDSNMSLERLRDTLSTVKLVKQ